MHKIWSYVTKKPTSLGSSAIILMVMVVASGLLGLVRLRVLYDRFTPQDTDISFAAFRIPNLLFEMLAAGALTSAFIPVFTKYITKNQHNDAYRTASILINLAVSTVICVSIPLLVWTEAISRLFAPGFSQDQINRIAFFTRSMIIFQVLPLLIGNFFTGLLQSYRLFLILALAPVLYNIGMILGIYFFSNQLGLYAAVLGVGIGALLFMLVQMPLVFSLGYRHAWNFNWRHPGVIEIGRLIFPRMIGLGASQVDMTADLILSSLIGPKMVSIFVLAQSLQQLPVRLFGGTISQAAFPSFSAASALSEMDNFKRSIMSAYRMIMFLVVPTSLYFIVLRVPIVRLIYGATRFDWEATVLTAFTLSTFSLSLFAQATSQIFVRAFYALYDSKTPVIVSIITILMNTFISIIFVLLYRWPVWSLGLSTSLSSIVNAGILLFLLYRKVGKFSWDDMIFQPLKVVFAAVISAVLVYIPLKLFDQLIFDTTHVFGLVMLTGFSGALGVSGYIFIAWVLDIPEIYVMGKMINRIKKLRSLLIEPGKEIIGG